MLNTDDQIDEILQNMYQEALMSNGSINRSIHFQTAKQAIKALIRDARIETAKHMYHGLQVCNSSEELAYERLKMLDYISELQAEGES